MTRGTIDLKIVNDCVRLGPPKPSEGGWSSFLISDSISSDVLDGLLA